MTSGESFSPVRLERGTVALTTVFDGVPGPVGAAGGSRHSRTAVPILLGPYSVRGRTT